ncbi:MAG TPA: hypothetical protein VJC10_00800 [Patescibacteria group bacterium]|nr:hypothetical protein [Patescibacteria group bacterium]
MSSPEFGYKALFAVPTHDGESVISHAYNSPLEAFQFGIDFQPLVYKGTLEQVLNDLEISFDPILVAVHPPRIIRAAIDYKVAHPESENALRLVRDATDLSLAFYRSETGARLCVSAFRELVQTVDEDLLTAPLIQKADSQTWDSSHPRHSSDTAVNLVSATKGTSIAFIALAHGGVMAGMDVFLRYCAKVKTESVFYPIRFSSFKQRDVVPQISSIEIAYLKNILGNKQLVLFDEDVSSGKTMGVAAHWFKTRLNTSVLTVANSYATQAQEDTFDLRLHRNRFTALN